MLYRATNVVAAYKETKIIIEGQLNKNSTWDKTLLESARSSLIFELIEKEKCIGDLVVQSLLSSFKKVPCEYSRLIIKVRLFCFYTIESYKIYDLNEYRKSVKLLKMI